MVEDEDGANGPDEPEPAEFAKMYGQLFQPMRAHFVDLAKSFSASIVMPKIDMPRIDVSRYLPQMTSMADSLGKQITRLAKFEDLVEKAFAPYAERWDSVFEQLGELKFELFPGNLQPVLPDEPTLEMLLVDEGIPLMWVPRSETIRQLIDAPSAADRRRIIGRRWGGIVNDCEAAILSVGEPELKEPCSFALDCVRALREGHLSAAQALAANLLDTVMQRHMSKSTRVTLTKNELKKKGIKFDLDEHKIRVACTFAPVWCAHAQYWPNEGDPIPRVFGRHPSVHGVSRLQYSRVNAVIGLMLVTSVLKFFDLEL